MISEENKTVRRKSHLLESEKTGMRKRAYITTKKEMVERKIINYQALHKATMNYLLERRQQQIEYFTHRKYGNVVAPNARTIVCWATKSTNFD